MGNHGVTQIRTHMTRHVRPLTNSRRLSAEDEDDKALIALNRTRQLARSLRMDIRRMRCCAKTRIGNEAMRSTDASIKPCWTATLRGCPWKPCNREPDGLHGQPVEKTMLNPDAAYRKDRTNAKAKNVMQHRHLAVIAGIINTRFSGLERIDTADKFAAELAKTNSNFDRERFLAACLK